MLNFGGLTILVDAEDADIEIVARIFEIIRIAPEKRHGLFWRKNDAHIVVTFVAIKVISAALIKRDHIRAQSGFLLALFFNCGNRSVACAVRCGGRHVRFDGALYARGHIFN